MEAALVFKHCLELRKCLLFKHNHDLAETEDVLGRAYASVEKWEEAINCVESSISRLKFIYGAESVEVGLEYVKLAELFLVHSFPAKALRLAEIAFEIVRPYEEKSVLEQLAKIKVLVKEKKNS